MGRSLILGFLLVMFPRPAAAGPPAAPGGIDWEAAADEAVADLSLYLRIDTSNPPGRTTEAVEFLRSRLGADGIPAETLDAGDGRLSLIARIRGTGSGKKPLVLLHHMDVVPADPDLWSHPPFAAEAADGYLYGRGAVDMKGMGILQLAAFRLVKRQGLALDRDLLYLAVADEETGGERGAAWVLANHGDRIDPEYVWDEGLTGTEGLFTAAGTVWGISVAEKKVFWLRLIAEGTAGHGSQPHDDNPVDRLAAALARLAAHRFPAVRTPVVAEIFARLGEPLTNKFTQAIQSNTCSLTTLRAGVGEPPKVNVIPSRAEATLDCRLLPDVDPAAFLESLKEILGRDPFDRGRMRFEPIQEPERAGVASPFDSELFRAMREMAEAERPGSVAVPVLVPWGTDSRYFRDRGAKAYGFIPIVVGPDDLARMHGVDERISIENLRLGIRLVYRILERFASP